MAQKETITLVKIETGEAQLSIGNLREAIKGYKKEMEAATVGSKEYQEASANLADAQGLLKTAMNLTTSEATEQGLSLNELKEQSKQVGTTYNTLVAHMADLRKQIKDVDVSTDEGKERFAKLAAEINATNDKLKDMDASMGNHQRNVGNYKSALDGLAGGFTATAGGAGSMINPVKNVTGGLKAMSATPAVAILGLLANVIVKVVDGLKSNEEAMNSVRSATAAFQPILDLVTKGVQALGNGVAWLVEKFTALTSKILGNNKAASERVDIQKAQIQLEQQQRKHMMENADAELRVSELRAKAAQKDKRTHKERIALLEQAAELEKKISERRKQDATLEYEIIKRTNALTASSKEEKDKEAQAYAKMRAAEKAYFDKTRELSGQIAEARKAMAAEVVAAAKAEEKAERDKEKAIKKANENIKKNDLKATADLRLAIEQRKNDREAYYAGLYQLALANYEKMTQLEDEENTEFLIRKQKAYNDAQAALQTYLDFQADQERLSWENRLAAMDENTFDYYNAEVEFKKWQVDQIELEGQRETETEEEYNARKIAAQKEYLAAKKDLAQKEIAIGMQVAQATSGLMGSIADALESNEEDAEKNANAIKGLRIASATIDTITGAIGAYMQAVATIPPPAGIIVGAIQAATVTAAGIANIAKIKSTKIGSGKGDSSNSATPSIDAVQAAPAYTPQVQETAIATGAMQEERLNEMAAPQRVYILNSDLEAASNARRVQTSETTF